MVIFAMHSLTFPYYVKSPLLINLKTIWKLFNFEYIILNGRAIDQMPTLLPYPVLPTIQHGQQILSTIEGVPVTLPCRASGIPKPSITWSKVSYRLSGVP